jgi:isoleucyl-tRNA synthetase
LSFEIAETDRLELQTILAEELNVKKIHASVAHEASIKLDTILTPALKREGLMRDIVRHVQTARKKAGLNVDDHISLTLTTEDADLQKAIIEHSAVIQHETLATEMSSSHSQSDKTYVEQVEVDGRALEIALSKI